MVFPQSGTAVARHPSPLYQFALEGLTLFVLVWLYARRPAVYEAADGRRIWGRAAAAFLFGYGVLRFIAEYFREPDAFLGLLSLGLSMGQWLCVPMVLVGAAVWVGVGRPARA
jgi:phosphatidylglycerol:prolipoprotein diacylglycerol transferase